MKKLVGYVSKPKQRTPDKNNDRVSSNGAALKQDTKARLKNSGATSTCKPVSRKLKEVKGSKSKATESSTNEVTAKTKLTFVCISDTHCRLDEADVSRIPYGDVLLHTGDFTMNGSVKELKGFNDFLGTLPHKYKVLIAGNHEECLAQDRSQHSSSMMQYRKTKYGVQRIRDLLTNCIYLEDELTVIHGIKIYGSPWTPMYSSCDAFSLSNDDRLQKKWDKIPDDVDILMTHGPPREFGDTTEHDIVAGCRSLLNTVQGRVKPKYHVFGHIHEGYGIYKDGTTTFINASICTRGYKPLNPPVTFKIKIPQSNCDTEHISGDECDRNVCDTLNCDIDCTKCESNINGLIPVLAACHETPSELKSNLIECDVDWNFSETDVTKLNYTKLTAREMNVTSNEM